MCMGVPSPGCDMISTTEKAPLVSAADVRIKQRSPGRVCNHSALPSCWTESSSRVGRLLIGISYEDGTHRHSLGAASISGVEQDQVERNYRQPLFGLQT